MKMMFLWLDINTGHRPSINHGVAWLSGCLKSCGHEVSCYSIKKHDELYLVVNALKEFKPDCVGFSITTNQRRYLDFYAKGIRENFKGLLICGGVHPTLDPEDTLLCGPVDGVCIGESEIPISTFAECIDKNTDYRETPSFWWKERKENGYSIKKNEVAPFVNNLEEFASPDYSVFEMEKLHGLLSGFTNIMVSRGCPYSCTYCCNHTIKEVYPTKKKYLRILSPKKAVDLLVEQKKIYPGIKGIAFEDDILLWNKDWFEEFSKEYKKRINLPFNCCARFDMIRDKKTVEMLKDAGCTLVVLGLESGDEEYRKKYLKRNMSDQTIINAATLMNESNLKFFTFNIFGLPFETSEMMENTISLNKRIRPSSGHVSFFYPYPNTELYKLCLDNNLIDRKIMGEVSGYREQPTINLTHCSKATCIKKQQNMFLFFMVRRLASVLKVNSIFFDSVVHRLLLLFPSFFTKLLGNENHIRKVLRKVQYFFLN